MGTSLLLGSIGLALGFVGSVPPAGPGSALLIRLSAHSSRRTVVGVALGCAVGEGLYALLATSALGWVVARYPFVTSLVATVGFLALAVCGLRCLALGIHTVADVPAPRSGGTSGDRSLGGAFVMGAAVALANPLPLLSWSTTFGLVVASLGLRSTTSGEIWFALGAAAGVFGWLALLGLVVARLSRRWGPQFDRWLLRGTAVALLSASVAAAARTFNG